MVSGNEPLPARSERTGTSYPSWGALVEAEANGYVAVAILTNAKQTWPWTEGPFATKHEAENARVRLRNRLKKEQRDLTLDPRVTAKFFVRPLWKPERRVR